MRAHVLGLGPTLQNFTGNQVLEDDITIGVNDCYRYYNCDYLFVGDSPRRFDRERLHWIAMSKPVVMFSNLESWRHQTLSKKFALLQFRGPRGSCSNLGQPFGTVEIPKEFICPYSISSPFTAACLAYLLGATSIILWGCDYNTHPVLSKKSQLQSVTNSFKGLQVLLAQRKVTMRLGVRTGALSTVLHG